MWSTENTASIETSAETGAFLIRVWTTHHIAFLVGFWKEKQWTARRDGRWDGQRQIHKEDSDGCGKFDGHASLSIKRVDSGGASIRIIEDMNTEMGLLRPYVGRIG